MVVYHLIGKGNEEFQSDYFSEFAIANVIQIHGPPRTLLIAHRVRQRPHERFYPGSTSKQKSIKPYKNLNVYELFKFLS